MNRTQIREIFLRNGFNIKPGCDDLKSYVYEAAEELLSLAEAERLSAVQGKPVAWSGWGCQYPGKMPRLYGERRIAELNCDWENGDQVLHFTAASQPAEQQPAPDAAGLVEALEQCITSMLDSGYRVDAVVIRVARSALAAHRKGALP